MITDTINAHARFKPDYGKQLSNHLPMTCFALDRLGATDAHIEAYIKQYVGRLEVAEVISADISADNWSELLGQEKYYLNYLDYFLAELEAQTLEVVLRTYLPTFIQSPAVMAYHCLLRLAYGIMSKNAQEIAAGLAYWADGFVILSDIIDVRNTERSGCVFDEIRSAFIDCDFKIKPADNIHSRLKNISQDGSIDEILNSGQLYRNATLNDIAEHCLQLYLSTQNFTMLHCMTGCHALRIISEYLDDEQKQEANLYFWQSVILAYVSIDVPKIKPMAEFDFADQLSEVEIKDRVKLEFDDHDVKIAFTAIEQARFYNDEKFLKAAV